MNEEITTKKCPYCKYLIPQDRLLCAYCGTISPTLWKKRVTDVWEIDKSIDGKGLDRLAQSIANKYNSFDGVTLYKYKDLHKVAEKASKLFLSKISIEMQQIDFDVFYDKFVDTLLIKKKYDYSNEPISTVKENYKLLVFEIGDLYRFIGKDDDTITLFEVSMILHDKIMEEIEKSEEREWIQKNERQDQINERMKKWNLEREEQYKKDLEEYEALPWRKQKFKKPPEKPR